MAKQGPQSPLNLPTQAIAKATHAMAAAEAGHDANGVKATVVPKARQIHKAGEVNISAYFPAEVKASLRMVQAKTGYNVKDCLAEALRDLFRKHNVPVSAELREGR
jgi:predicted lipid-binding transport protein (Tim44 family)